MTRLANPTPAVNNRKSSPSPNGREKEKFRRSANLPKQAKKPAPKLERITFQTSRELDFFSEQELNKQTGHEREEWPLVIVKELLDNSLDACETANITPVIEVTVDESSIAVQDNGPGLPEETLKGALNFNVRASDKAAYVSPSRGQQGNALKCLIPMPWVIDPDDGKLFVAAHGKCHAIRCGADPISQRAVIHDDVTDQKAKGTTIRLTWKTDWPIDDEVKDRVRDLVAGFAVFNPHATIRLDLMGEEIRFKATNRSWQKWKPNQPTSAHWYEPRHLERLIAAYVTHDRERQNDRLVSEFLAEFDGLAGSAKRTAVLTDSALHRANLSDLVKNERLDSKRIEILLSATQRHTRPVNPLRLGIIGEDHLKTRLLAMGVQEESFRYEKIIRPKSKKSENQTDDKGSFIELPSVLESAFGWLGNDAADNRRIFSGANWSAAIKNPFRSFGHTGEGLETQLYNLRATRCEPVIFVLHLAQPRVDFTDAGKSAIGIGAEVSDD
jgi:DNA topoisomerase VI subunit B